MSPWDLVGTVCLPQSAGTGSLAWRGAGGLVISSGSHRPTLGKGRAPRERAQSLTAVWT